jgi:hypothetical protein
VDEEIELSRQDHLPTYGRFTLVLLLSFALHLLLLWLAGYLSLDTPNHSEPAKPRTLQLTLFPSKDREIAAKPQDKSKISNPADNTEVSKQDSGSTITEEHKEANDSPSTTTTQAQTSSARILAKAKEIAREMALLDESETQRKMTHIESALQKAFNPQKEPAGVKSLVDGTIRVVTEYGVVYCIRPSEDWRILGPEDAMPLVMTCR